MMKRLFIPIFIVCSFFAFNSSLKVKATTNDLWGLYFDTVTDSRFFDCTSSTNCDTQLNSVNVFSTRTYIAMDTTATIGSNGLLIANSSLQIIEKNYLYSVNLYFCSNKNIISSTVSTYANSYGNRGINSSVYDSTALARISTKAFSVNTDINTYCYRAISLIVNDSSSSFWLFHRFKSTPSITGVALSSISLEIENLGLYTPAIENIIKNAVNSSGVATNEQLQQATDEIKEETKKIDDTINNDNVTESNTEYSNFFSGFTTNTHGLTSIITAPLSLIGSITSSSCSPLGLPLPFINETLPLPCLSTIYSTYFGSFFTIYQTITFGIIAYWVIVRIFNLVKDFKNPDHDEIEVLDL